MSEFHAYNVGHLLDVDKSLGWALFIAHRFVLCQTFNNDLKGVWFKEGTYCFCFGVDEFCLITGLKGLEDEDAKVPDKIGSSMHISPI